MSPLPDFEIDRRKLTHYLLNAAHPGGRSKAKLFLGNGFDVAKPEVLAEALVGHAIAGWPGETESGPFGTKIVIKGEMPMPNGTTHIVWSVWQKVTDRDCVRLITAY